MQAESTLVDISDAKTSKELKSEGENEEISIHPEPNDEISIANDIPPSTQKYQQKQQQEQLFITNNYTFSLLALLFIAIAMSAIVLTSPKPKSLLHGVNDLDDDYGDDSGPSNDNSAVTEGYNDVNSSFIDPERAKFEFIHGQLKDLSICLILFNISDLNGACLVHNPKNFIDASEACTTHNMTLLEMNSDLEKQRVFDETEKIFGTGGGTRIWMNGKYSVDENAFLSHPKNERFYITNEQIENGPYGSRNGFSDGECLAVESWYQGRYHISSVPCRGAHYFYCEF